jgi:type I site-specific restriction-modification system R (restriction) subunit
MRMVICLQISTPFEVGGIPGSEEILPELIQAEGEPLVSALHKLINCIWNKEELLDPLKEYILYEFTKRVIKLTVLIIMRYHCYQLHTKFY